MGIFSRIKQIVESEIGDIKSNKNSNLKTEQPLNLDEETKTYDNSSEYSQQELEFYANLEISPGTKLPEIKKAYKLLMKKFHPDLHDQDEDRKVYAEKICKKLNEAMAYFEKHIPKETEKWVILKKLRTI